MKVNGECYTGWLDYWGGGHAHGSTTNLITGLLAIRDLNASVNMLELQYIYTYTLHPHMTSISFLILVQFGLFFANSCTVHLHTWLTIMYNMNMHIVFY